MSRDPGEPPRRPKPKPRSPDNPDIDGEGPSTFRPSGIPADPPRAPAGGAPRRAKGEPREVTGGPGLFERVVFGSVSSGHLATFCRQASAYLEAGVDLGKSLASLETQFARTALGPVIGRLHQAIRRGDELGDAAAREPQAFDELFLSMVRVAEARGGLPETLRRMARHYEARQRMIRQARSALIYPTIVIIVALGVIWLLTAFVLPKLVGILQDMTRGRGASLPTPTRILMAISDFIQGVGWWAVPLAAVVGVFVLLRLYRTPAGKAAIDEVGLMVPVLGTLLKKLDTTRFARTLGALLDAGVDYGQSLDLTADVVRTSPMRRAVRAARAEVVEGIELSRALDASRRFPSDVIAMVETGEETGRLPETLDKLADGYEEQVEQMLKNLSSLVQPLIIIVLGGIVFFILLAFISAYVSIISGLAGGG